MHEFLEWVPPEVPKPIIGDQILDEQGRMFFYGKYKSLKSMAAMHLALCIVGGDPWFGFKTNPMDVMYLQIEVSHFNLQKRFMKMYNSWHEKVHTVEGAPKCTKCGGHHNEIIFWTEPSIKLDTPGGLSKLHGYLTKFKPKLLIIDPMYKIQSGNMLDPNVFRDFSDILDKIGNAHGLAIIVVAHSSKKEIDDNTWGSDDLMGPALISAWADSIIKITRHGGQSDLVTVNFDLVRNADKPIEEVRATLDPDTLDFKILYDALPKGTRKKKEKEEE